MARCRSFLPAVTLVALLLLAGCTGAVDQSPSPSPAPETEPVETTSKEDARAEGEAIVDKILGDDTLTVEPDEDVMASMTCVPLTQEQLESLALRFGIFDRGVSVDVTKKNGVTWKVVALQQTAADGSPTRLAYLTDATDLGWGEGETWIELRSDDPWRNVDWDEDLLVRAQSALTLAKSYLSEDA